MLFRSQASARGQGTGTVGLPFRTGARRYASSSFAGCLLRLRQRVAQLLLMRQEATVVRFLAEVVPLVVMLGFSAFQLMHWLAD